MEKRTPSPSPTRKPASADNPAGIRLSALAFRLIGVIGICLFGFGVLTDTTAMSVVGAVLLGVALAAGLLDVRRGFDSQGAMV